MFQIDCTTYDVFMYIEHLLSLFKLFQKSKKLFILLLILNEKIKFQLFNMVLDFWIQLYINTAKD